MEFKGYVIELSKKLKGAIITLYESPDGSHENLTEIYKTVSPGNGEFEFKLEINKFFVLSVEKGGYTTKMVDFDTDVTLAREQYTTVPKFEFQVDMVQDLDGLAFTRAVAAVFYQIKRNEFDYQLDYSKEDMENEEIELRKRQEKERMAQQAYEKKQALEEAAKMLLDKENASAQEIIAAAITVGDGNKDKTIKGFLEVFPEVDTLRQKKAEAMYDQLLEERKQSKATGSKLNFQAIFASAKIVEDKVVKEAEEKREAKVAVLKAEKEEAAQKSKEVMAIQQKAIELQAQEKLATAIANEEVKKKQEEIEKKDKVYYAIFNSNGESAVAIQNLVKTFPKTDPYKEEKAKAIFEAYEKERLTGTTLSNMNFGNLFKAADIAEQAAIQKELEKDRSKGKTALDEFKERVAEQKEREQEQIIGKIETGLKDAPRDRASQVAIFKDALPKNDPYKEEKANAMYEHYVKQKKSIEQIEVQLKTAAPDKESQLAVFYNALPDDTPDRDGVAQRMYDDYVQSKQAQGGTGAIAMDFGSLFMVADRAAETAQAETKEKNALEKLKAQQELEAKREDIRKEKSELAVAAEIQVKDVHQAELAKSKNKKESDLASAIEKGAGDRDKSVEAIQKALPQTDDKEMDRERAEAVFDAYLLESERIKKSGNTGSKIDFSVLFAAADGVELAKLEREFQQKQAQEDQKLAKYEEQRTEKAIDIAKVQQKRAEQEAEQAAVAYEETLHKVEIERQERLTEQKKQEEELEKTLAMQQAKREVLEKERAAEELAVVEQERTRRLEQEKKEAEILAAADTERKNKEAEAAAKAAREQLALLEKRKQEADQAAEADRKAQELAAKKQEADRLKEEQKDLAYQEKIRKEQEVAQAQAADAERKRLEDEANKQKAEALAAQKAEQDRIKEEQRLLAEAEKARLAKEIADAKAAEEAKKLADQREIELAQQKAAQLEQDRKANYNKLISIGDQALAQKDYSTSASKYKEALAMYPENKDATKKLGEAEAEVRRVEKEEAAKLAIDQRYDVLLSEADEELASENFDAAKAKLTKAGELKPESKDIQRKIADIDKKVAQLAAEQKAKQEAERRFVLVMQEAAKLLESGKLDESQSKYEEARSMKPTDAEPIAKLKEIEGLKSEIAAAAEEKKRREKEAEKKFADQQEAERIRKDQEAALVLKEQEARLAALGKVDENKAQQQKTVAELEKERIEKYEKLQESLKSMDLTEDEQRKAFLSELAKIYPEGLTKETVQGKNFVLVRHVINESNVVTIYEKKTWDWGGVFYFKNADIAITEAIYKLEIGKY
ncbi:MAG: hypothetical protein K9J17_04605 [Flavobacteriales bacterium]|nr:hypothetical protein [Flavobacteriales bacterium]